MADLSEIQSAQYVKVAGGNEANALEVDSSGRARTASETMSREAIYQTSNLLSGTTANMNVNGATTPVSFRFTPAAGSGIWHIESLALVLTDNTNFTLQGFGGLPALANGVQINIQSKGTLYTLQNLQTTIDLLNTFSEHHLIMDDGGIFGSSRTLCGLTKWQQRMVLDSSLGDYFEARVRDNLTGLTDFYLRAKTWRLNG